MPPPITPDQIYDYAPRHPRVLHVDANVAAYFGRFFHSFRQTLLAAPKGPAVKVPLTAATASPLTTASPAQTAPPAQ